MTDFVPNDPTRPDHAAVEDADQLVTISADARNRAWRTFLQGLVIDMLAGLGIVLVPAFTSVEWTRLYWLALAASVGRTLLQTFAAYLWRYFVAPKVNSPAGAS